MADEPTEQAQAASEQQASEQAAEPSFPTTEAELDALATEVDNPRTAPAGETVDAGLAEKDAETTEEEATEETTEETQEATDDTVEDKAPKRVRMSDLPEVDRKLVNNAVQLVRDGQAANIEEAIAKITGTAPAKTEATQEATQEAEAIDEHKAAVDSKLEAITEIKTKLAKAKADFDTDAEMELIDQLLEAKSDLKLMQYSHDQEAKAAEQSTKAQAETAFDTEYSATRDRANALFPDATNPESALYEQIRKDVAHYEKTNPAFFNSPEYPLALVGMAAAKLGIAPATAKTNGAPAPAKPNLNGTPPRTAARPANPLVGGDATSGIGSADHAWRQVESLRSEQDLDALAEAVFAGR